MKSKIALILLAVLTLQAFGPMAHIHASTTAVVSVTPSVSAITDLVAGEPFSITTKFAAPMDTTVTPTIIFTPDLLASGTLTYTDTSWSSDGTIYTINYVVHDLNEQYPSVNALILGIVDIPPPPLPPPNPPPAPPYSYDAPNLFSVDTVTPMIVSPNVYIVSAVPSVPVINDSLAGQNFSITVTYSAPLDVTQDSPSIILDSTTYVALPALTWTSDTWSNNNTVLTSNYTVNDLNQKIPSIDALIIGGIVANTFPSQPLGLTTKTGLFAIDTISPVVTADNITTTGATGNNGVYKIGDTITVSWNNTASADNNDDVASVAVDFSQFGGPSSVGATNTGDIWTAGYTMPEGTIDNVANINSSISVTDTGGNVVTMQDDANVTVDNKINGYQIAINQPYINISNQNALSFTFTSAEIGATYDYDINGNMKGTGTITTANDTVTGIDVSSLTDGTLTLSVNLTDVAGNVGTTVIALQKTKDTILPTATTAISSPTIDLTSVGTQINATVKFDEAMNMAFMPTIAFSPNIVSRGTLTVSTISWLDNKTYRIIYDTHNASENQPNISVTVSDGKDQYDNQMNTYTANDLLAVDTVPIPPILPAPKKPFVPHSSPSDGRQVNPNTNQIPGYVPPVVVALAPTPVVTTVVAPSLTKTIAPVAHTLRQSTVITPAVSTVAVAEPVRIEPVKVTPIQTVVNNQIAAAAGAGIDLFSGNKIYDWLLILICLIIFTRVAVALVRREHR